MILLASFTIVLMKILVYIFAIAFFLFCVIYGIGLIAYTLTPEKYFQKIEREKRLKEIERFVNSLADENGKINISITHEKEPSPPNRYS